MPRQNAARKAAPVHRKEQPLLDDELAETERRHEALDDDANLGVTSTPTSPTKIAMGEDSAKSGMLGRALGFLGLSRKAHLEEPQDVRPVKEADDVARDELPSFEGEALPIPDPSTSRAELATANTTTLKSPSRASSLLTKSAKRKRASDAERQDLYEVPIERVSHNSEPEEPPTNRPAKRTRTNGKAKTPLTLPKTSKGRISLQHTTHTRGSPTAETGKVETTPTVRAASSVNGNRDTTEVEQQIPKKRGRPRKNKVSEYEAARDAAINSPNKTGSVDHAIVKSVAAASRRGTVPQATEDVDEGISDILLNPSPVKVTRQESRPAAPITQQQQGVSKSKNRARMNSIPELSDDEDDLFVGKNDEESGADDSDEMEIEEEQASADRATNEPRRIPFDPKLIERMWEISKHVGHKFDAKEKIWSRGGRFERLWSGPGKRMLKQLKTLISSYEKLQQSKLSGDRLASRDARKDVEKALHILSVETEAVVTERLGLDFDDEKPTATLTDLYFNIIPNCIYALKKAVAVYNVQGSMETDFLQEILLLVSLIHDLADAAVAQPKEIQPRPATSLSYQISQPTRSNLPDIRSLQKIIKAELRFRTREKERAKKELSREERERQFVEKQEQEDAEIRRKRDERHRMQGESWWTVRNNYFPSPWNRILQTDIARLEAARKGKCRQESVELGYPRMSRAESRQGVERVSVFPANNVKANSSMSSLSKEDTLSFIDCMRYEQGADRYERAAEQIGRSMDEVFAFAKEFQEAMDLQHQEGNFNEARDSWTYSVWVEQE